MPGENCHCYTNKGGWEQGEITENSEDGHHIKTLLEKYLKIKLLILKQGKNRRK